MSNVPAMPIGAERASLKGGSRIDVAALDLTHERVPADQDGGDSPSTGSVDLGTLAGVEFGVWEMSAGTMLDIEAEEILLVTAGRGNVLIEAFGTTPKLRVELFPGALMRLSEGMKTTWTVTETLRKVYLTPTTDDPGTAPGRNNS